MAEQPDKEKEPLKPLTEEEIQHRLYGDIIGKLEPIKREVAETKKQVYHWELRKAVPNGTTSFNLNC